MGPSKIKCLFSDLIKLNESGNRYSIIILGYLLYKNYSVTHGLKLNCVSFLKRIKTTSMRLLENVTINTNTSALHIYGNLL